MPHIPINIHIKGDNIYDELLYLLWQSDEDLIVYIEHRLLSLDTELVTKALDNLTEAKVAKLIDFMHNNLLKNYNGIPNQLILGFTKAIELVLEAMNYHTEAEYLRSSIKGLREYYPKYRELREVRLILRKDNIRYEKIDQSINELLSTLADNSTSNVSTVEPTSDNPNPYSPLNEYIEILVDAWESVGHLDWIDDAINNDDYDRLNEVLVNIVEPEIKNERVYTLLQNPEVSSLVDRLNRGELTSVDFCKANVMYNGRILRLAEWLDKNGY